MAESAARALTAAGPGARMLVVAGRGHIEEFTGIPDRLQKRAPGVRRVVVIGDQTDKSDGPPTREENGQFVVSFPEIDDPPAPKLGVTFDTKPSAAGLLVTSVVPGGAAAKAGVAAGDRIARLAGAAVTDMTDLRYVLDAGKTGDVAVEVLRDGANVPLSVTLAPPPPPAQETASKK
jgi:S1-C subfamily serine protease